jgi:hypothetical protein
MNLTFQLYLNDENKPTDTKANLRPVALSDVSPNVFEKTTLTHVRTHHPVRTLFSS